MPIISASDLRLLYGALEVFSGITLEVSAGRRVGLVGPNGGGKTSLLRLLVGEIEPSTGRVSRTRGLRLGYVSQTPGAATLATLRDEVMVGLERVRRVEADMAASGLAIQLAEGSARREAEQRYSRLLQEFEALGGHDYPSRLERVANGVGLSESALDAPASSASGGQRTRAALAAALLGDPDLLLLDEPTNYLDFDGLDWLESFLSRRTQAFVVVSHDRYFLDKVVSEIWELDHGRLRTFPGNYSKYRALKVERDKRQQAEYERQQEFIAKEEAFIQRYRAGQRAREAKGRSRRLERLQRIDAPESTAEIRVNTASSSRTGRAVVTLRDLAVGYEEDGRSVTVLKTPEVEMERGSRAAIIGANGAGKTTLVRTIVGAQRPLSGQVALGHGVQVGYYTQGSVDLPEDSTVLEAMLDAGGMTIAEARNYLAGFLFRGEDVFSPVTSLSGGQRSRLTLARLIVQHPNFLVLDEPTTHLDIASREALEQALLGYDGTLLFVSHDRRLITLLAGKVWALHDGEMRVFDGGFEEWERLRRAGVDAPAPKIEARPQTGPQTRPRNRAEAARERQNSARARDHERLISETEDHLKELERQLQEASERQDSAAIARLGVEYDETKARLEQAWDEWSG